MMQITLKDEQLLNDTHIDYFGLLLKNCSEYQPRETWRIQCPDSIEPVLKDQKHIQILYSCSDTSNLNGHWVCSYYDTKRIYIYDSLNLKRLHEYHKIIFEKLYPFYPFKKKPVQFPKVQGCNSNNYGDFAIAFAVSLLFNLRPDTVMYNENLMREHLVHMFQSKKLEHFPRIIRPGDPKQLFSLHELQRRQILANKRRERRQRSKKESSVNLQKSKQNIGDMTTKKNVTNILHTNNIQIILRGEWLEDIHMDHFGSLLKMFSEYEPRETWKIQCPDRIKPVSKDKKHIQILHSCDNMATNLNGHWVCSYYDTKMIYIYDSLNSKRLHVHHKIYLEKLYPFYAFDKQSIQFPTVQNQSNGYDCGVFAIAFAVSLLYGLQPDAIMYDQSLMRRHLVQMFQLNKIEQFPTITRPDPEQLTDENIFNQNNIKYINNITTIKNLTLKHGVKRKINYIEVDNNNKQKKSILETSESVLLHKTDKTEINLFEKKSITNNLLITKQEKKNVRNKKFYKLHREKLLAKQKEYYKYKSHREKLLAKQKQDSKKYYKSHREKLLAKQKENSKKYYKLHREKLLAKRKEHREICNANDTLKNNVKLKYTKEKYIRNISKFLRMSSLYENRLEAERIVKWCFYTKTLYIIQMKRIFKKCKQKAEVCLTRATEFSTSNINSDYMNTPDTINYINAFCGLSKHTASTELYFGETTYHTFKSSESIIMNSEGKAINILPVIKLKNKKKVWSCSSLCKIEGIIINDLKRCFQELLNCTLKNVHKFLYCVHNCFNRLYKDKLSHFLGYKDKLGHPHGCYIDYKSCGLWFLAIEIISPHYPKI